MAKATLFLKNFWILAVLIILNGCTSIRPLTTGLDDGLKLEEQQFGYTRYAELLNTHVDTYGFIDYQKLVRDPRHLDHFYAQISRYSPDSHPALFPSENDKLAYWINAYNATVLKGVVENYPISSVEDVKTSALLFFFPSKSGFFLFQRFTYGGIETSLYYLENSVIRGRFSDPRIHFALNCASRSCPRLPQVPFKPEVLEEQLEQEARKFINDETRVRYDSEQNTLYLSSIFKWYRDDFTDWLENQHPEVAPTLTEYVLLYLNAEIANIIKTHKDSLKVDFLDYDWGLNDRL